MYKRLILVIFIIMFVATVGNVEATIRFQNLDGNHRWDDGNNWYDDVLLTTVDPPGPGQSGYIDELGAPYSGWAEIDAVHCTGVNDVNVGHIRVGATANDDALLKVTGGEIYLTGDSIYLGLGAKLDRSYRAKMTVGAGSKIYATHNNGLQVGKNWAYDSVYEQTGGDVNVMALCLFAKAAANGTGHTAYLSGGTLSLRQDPLYATAKFRPLYRGNDTCQMVMSGGSLILTHANATVATIEGYITDGLLTTPFAGGREKWTIDDSSGDVVATVVNYVQGAWNFRPPNGSDLDRYDTTFVWNPGEDINTPDHRVYWSTDKTKVETADPTVKIKEDDVNSVTVSPMTLGETYYLRVDEIDGISAKVWEGSVLTYTVNNYVEIDNIEGYASSSALRAVWNDGYAPSAHIPSGNIGNEASLSIAIEPIREIWEEHILLQQSTQSMQMWYSSGSFNEKSEIMRDYGAGDLQDFSTAAGGVEALVIYFHGADGNGQADDLYCALEDNDGNDAVAYYPDKTDLDQGVWSLLWHEFNIDLSVMAAADVDLTIIRKIYIGIGDYAAGTATAANSGNVFFEDIGLYPERCVFSEGPIADFSYNYDGIAYYDCTVGYEDLGVMRGSWLESAPGTVTNLGGLTGTPIVVWNFDETAGNIARDSANIDSNNYDLTATDLATTHWVYDATNIGTTPWATGYVLEFDGAFTMGVTDLSQLAPLWGYFDNAITLSMWTKGDSTAYSGTVGTWPGGGGGASTGCMFWAGQNSPARMVVVNFPQTYQLEVGGCLWRCGDNDLVGSSPADYDDCRWATNTKGSAFYGQWNHLAFTKDRTTGKMVTYINGEIKLIEANRTIPFRPTLAAVPQTSVGGNSTATVPPGQAYYGMMCDVRLFNYALPHEEILYLADVASVSQGLMLQGDCDADNDVDLKDYAVLVNTFLDVLLWP
ncbi:MAG: LamG-like jellyroll fold domain-containing protein [Planctomycetota bacterium]|jgi:hypothetical protein